MVEGEEGIEAADRAFLADNDGPDATAVEFSEDRRRREKNRRNCMKKTDKRLR